MTIHPFNKIYVSQRRGRMEQSFVRAILYGWITIFVVLLGSSFILALITRFSSISESTIAYISIALGFFILFCGGMIAGLKGKANGLIIGLFTGGGFTLMTFLVQYLGFDQFFSLKQLIYHVLYMLIAIVGSILGVNLVQTKNL